VSSWTMHNSTWFLCLRRAHQLLLLFFNLNDLVRLIIRFRARFLRNLLAVELNKISLSRALAKVLGIVGNMQT
jgi:hypothetical protein